MSTLGRFSLFVFSLTVVAPPVWGAITYVDAVPNTDGSNGNTTINGALVDFTAETGNANEGTGQVGLNPEGDEKWGHRLRNDEASGSVNGTGVWENGAADDAEPLITTILGLADGTYDLYGVFWNNNPGTPPAPGVWDVGFRVGDTGDFSNFDVNNSDLASVDGSEFDGAVVTRDPPGTTDSQQVLIASLGTFNVTGGSIEIYVDDPDLGVAGDARTWYDGVGYELSTAPVVPGDFDGDGDVDGADFVVWQTNFPTQTGATLATGDADGDGDVDGADFVIWQTNFPFTPSAGVTAVPEPTAWTLAMLGGLFALALRQRR